MFETFSKRRKKRELAGQPDVYQYDDLPPAFRNQVIWIWVRAIGPYYDSNGQRRSAIDELHRAQQGSYRFQGQPLSNQVWDFIAATIAEETGQLQIGEKHRDSLEKCIQFLQSSSVDNALDILDLSFHIIDDFLRSRPDEERSTTGKRE